ncbi:WW domain containing protein [Nitzschia inconspicua]|uniref:WW domain containing protein n=1 Tax=Nitzschia inconspicua TaxID=303405 RepID=A0A9K3LBZ6_9STRA|nr:WW domain containing protein [Nitzschia inconspicua]
MWSQLSNAPPPVSEDNRRRFPPPPVPHVGSGVAQPPPMPPPVQHQVNRPPRPASGGIFPPPPPPNQPQQHHSNGGHGIRPSGSSDHESYADDDEYSDDGALGATINMVTSAASRFFKAAAAAAPPPPQQQQQQPNPTPEPPKGPPPPTEPASSMLDTVDNRSATHTAVPPSPPVAINNSEVRAVKHPGIVSTLIKPASNSGIANNSKPPTPIFRPPSQPSTPVGPIQPVSSFGSATGAKATVSAIPSPRPPPIPGQQQSVAGGSTSNHLAIPTLAQTAAPHFIHHSPGGQRTTFLPPTPPSQHQQELFGSGNSGQSGNVTPSAPYQVSGPPTPSVPTIPSILMQPNLAPQRVQQQPGLSTAPMFPPPNTPIISHPGIISATAAIGNRPPTPKQQAKDIFGQPPMEKVPATQPPPTPAPTPAQTAYSVFGIPSPRETSPVVAENETEPNRAAKKDCAPPAVPSLQTVDGIEATLTRDPPVGLAKPIATPPPSPKSVEMKLKTIQGIKLGLSNVPSSPLTPVIANQQQKSISSSLSEPTQTPNTASGMQNDTPLQPSDVPKKMPFTGTAPNSVESVPFATSMPLRSRLRAPPPMSTPFKSSTDSGISASTSIGSSATKPSRSKFRLPTPRKRVAPALVANKKKEEDKDKEMFANLPNDTIKDPAPLLQHANINKPNKTLQEEMAESTNIVPSLSSVAQTVVALQGGTKTAPTDGVHLSHETSLDDTPQPIVISKKANGTVVPPETQQEPTTAAEVESDRVTPSQVVEAMPHGENPEVSIPTVEELNHVGNVSTTTSAVESSLSEGWTEATDPSSGNVYFFNESTGETSWEKPLECQPANTPTVGTIDEVAITVQGKNENQDQRLTTEEFQPIDNTIDALNSEFGVDSQKCIEPPEVVLPVNERETKIDEDVIENPVDDTKDIDEDLPDGWIEAFDPSSARSYYYHSESGQVSWERPTESSDVNDAAHHETKGTIPFNNSPESTKADKIDVKPSIAQEKDTTKHFDDDNINYDETLHDGWEDLVDPSTNQRYFYNSVTGETSWDRPTAGPSGEILLNNAETEVATIEEAYPQGEAEPEISVKADTNENDGLYDADQSPESTKDATEQVDDDNVNYDETLPDGWVDLVDPSTNQRYFYNSVTGETSWDRPTARPSGEILLNDTETEDATIEEASPQGDAEPEISVKADTDTNENDGLYDADQSPESTKDAAEQVDDDNVNYDETLHDGWEDLVDPSTNQRYFYNSVTGETSWDRPTAGPSGEILLNNAETEVATIEEAYPQGEAEPEISVKADTNENDGLYDADQSPESTKDATEQVDDDNVNYDETLPDGWVDLVDPSTNQRYFYNSVTGETSWDPPTARPSGEILLNDAETEVATIEKASPQGQAEPEISVKADTDTNENDGLYDADQSPESTKDATEQVDDDNVNYDETLPDGWVDLVDPSTNQRYFYNSVTGETSWDRPTARPSGEILLNDTETEDATIEEASPQGDAEPEISVKADTDTNENDGLYDADQSPESTKDAAEQVDDDNVNYDETLPGGWEDLVDPSTNQRYFYNSVTGETSWDQPTAGPSGEILLNDAETKVATIEEAYPQGQAEPEISVKADTNENDGLYDADQSPESTKDATEQVDDDNVNYDETLPDGWADLVDPSTNQRYFYNSVTGETSWNPPTARPSGEILLNNAETEVATIEEASPQGQAEPEISVKADTDTNENDGLYDADQSPESTKDATEQVDDDNVNYDETLPDGWVDLVDPSTNQRYFYNSVTGETSWDRPTAGPSGEILLNNAETEVATIEEASPQGEAEPEISVKADTNENDGLYDADQSPESTKDATEQVDDDNVNYDETLPDGWVDLVDPSTNQRYFYNSVTGETSWDQPTAGPSGEILLNDAETKVATIEEAYPQGEAEPEISVKADTNENDGLYDADQSPESTKDATEQVDDDNVNYDETLPDGWVDLVDPSTNQRYFYNSVTGETSWDPPTARPSGEILLNDAETEVATIEKASPQGQAEPEISVKADTDTNENDGLYDADQSPESTKDATEQVDDDNVNYDETLPDGWVDLVDPSTNQRYFYNSVTGETSWDPPTARPSGEILLNNAETEDATIEEASPQGQAEPEISVKADTDTNENDGLYDADQSPESTKDATEQVDDDNVNYDETLPDGWVDLVDPSTNQRYFYNSVTGETSWDRPTAGPSGVILRRDAETEVATIEEASSQGEAEPILDNKFDREIKPEKTSLAQAAMSPVDSSQNEQMGELPSSEHVSEASEEVNGIDPLPDGWVEAFDPKGTPYYYHSLSGTVSWERPIEGKASGSDTNDLDMAEGNENADKLLPNDEVEVNGMSEVNADLNSKQDCTEEAVGTGWSQIIDPDSGEIYFFNDITGETTWELPKDNPSAPSSEGQMHKQIVRDSVSPVESKKPKAYSSLSPDAPSGSCWTKCFDPDSNGTYYLDQSTGKILWDKPEDQESEEVRIQKENQTQSNDGHGINSGEDESVSTTELNNDATDNDCDSYGDEKMLPEEWVEAVDESSGNIYFYNYRTGEVSWERPMQFKVSVHPPKESHMFHARNESEDAADGLDSVKSEGEIQRSDGDVSEANCAANSEGWVEMKDPLTQKDYFYNTQTGETMWVRPLSQTEPTSSKDNFDVDPPIPDEEERSKTGASEMDHGKLPEGWVVDEDPKSGKPYYYHSLSGKVTWETPVREATQSCEASISSSDSETENHLYEEKDENSEEKFESQGEDAIEIADKPETENVAAASDKSELLPDGWEVIRDPDSDDVFYYNKLTNETSWEKPVVGESMPHEALKDTWMEVPGPITNETIEASDEVSGDKLLPLLEGWVESFDESSGKTFYWNESTNETTWDRPVATQQPSAEKKEDIVEIDGTELNKKEEVGMDGNGSQPKDWIEMVDKDSGQKYYYNVVTQETSWESPNKRHSLEPLLADHKVHTSMNGEILVSVEDGRQQLGIRGPLVLCEDSHVAAYLEHKTNSTDLLWQLIAIAAKSQGRLRSDEGVSDKSSPEAAIIELLLRDEKTSVTSPKKEAKNSNMHASEGPKQPDATARIQRLLLRGDKAGAIEEAIALGDFATALLVASRCNEATYIGVARKYAERSFYNGSPMYTAALLFSGAADWGAGNWGLEPQELKLTWKSHLAAIISNRTPGCERIVLSLGDRLMEIGDVKDAHFCYMVCGCSVEDPTDGHARLALLGCDHTDSCNLVLSTRESIEAFERTEAFEWAKRQGNKNASLVRFQPFKLIYSMLLVDNGMSDLALLYIDSIRVSSKIASVEHLTGSNIGLNQIFSDETAFLIALLEVKSRLQSQGGPKYRYSNTVLNGGTMAIERALLEKTVKMRTQDVVSTPTLAGNQHKTALTDKSDPDVSYLSAKSNLMDVTGYSLDSPEFHNKFTSKKSEIKSLSPLQEGASKENVMTDSVDQANGKRIQKQALSQSPVAVNNASDIVKNKAPLNAPLYAAKTSNHTQQTTVMETPQERKRPNSPPATAPPRIGDKSAEKPKVLTPAPSSGSSFGSLKSWIIKRLNPDATECHLPDSEGQAYYDKEKKRWIFPDMDPNEEIQPLAPPPKTPVPSNPQPVPTPKDDDPLAAMMAPPSRAPSSIKRPGGIPKTTPGRYPPGMMPPVSSGMSNSGASAGGGPASFAASAPPFAVFTPKLTKDD